VSLIPAFELGLWNAWIFVLLSLLIGFMSWVFIGKKAMKKFRIVPNVAKTNAEKVSDKTYLPLSLIDSLPKEPTEFLEILFVYQVFFLM